MRYYAEDNLFGRKDFKIIIKIIIKISAEPRALIIKANLKCAAKHI